MYSAVGRLWWVDEAERSKTLALVADRLRPIAEFAAERGVKLAVEPLNRYETSLVNTVDQALALIEALGARGAVIIGPASETFTRTEDETSLLQPKLPPHRDTKTRS